MNTEEKILKAAEEIFVRDGYDGARMKAIAEQAEINKALLHYYFRSKENLFNRIFHEKLSQFIPKLGAVIFNDKTIIEKFELVVDKYMEFLLENPKLPIFVVYTINKSPDFLNKIPVEIMQGLTKNINREIKRKTIAAVDARQFILSVISMCIFPFIASPIAKRFFNQDDKAYLKLLKARSTEIKKYIRLILTPKN